MWNFGSFSVWHDFGIMMVTREGIGDWERKILLAWMRLPAVFFTALFRLWGSLWNTSLPASQLKTTLALRVIFYTGAVSMFLFLKRRRPGSFYLWASQNNRICLSALNNQTNKNMRRASASCTQVLAAKPADLSSVARTHMVEGENPLPQVVL